MNIRSLSLLVLACSLIPGSAIAQMGIAKGRIVDQDGKPVADVAITFDYLGEMNRKFETKTDDKGRYTQVVNSGRYRITATADGYRGTYIDGRIPSGPATDIDDLEILNVAVAAERAFAPVLKQFEEAGRLSKEGKLDEALAVYEGLLPENDELPELHFNIGALHARQEEWPEAEAAFRRTLELKPDQLNAALSLAGVLESQGRADEADAVLQGLADQNPDNPEVLYELARGLVNADRLNEARPVLERIFELEPERAEGHYLMAIIALNRGENDEAIGRLERYLELAPDNALNRGPAEKILEQLKAAVK